jgi:transcriptional regulator with XRE-family HTH domain
MKTEPLTKLRRARLRMGKSLTQLARELGVSKATVSKVERGLQSPSLELVIALARATGVPPVQIRPDLAPLMQLKMA